MARIARALMASVVVLGFSATALAAGFQVREQSAVGLGRAYAGEAVAAEDASGVFYNPAQAATVEPGVTVAASGFYADTTLTNDGSALRLPNGALVPVTGATGEDPIDPTLIPSAAAVWRLNPRLAFAASINAPFGLVADYGEDVFARYDAGLSELRVIDVSAAAAWRVIPSTTVGVGAHAQSIEATLANALPDPLGRGAAFDGRSQLEGDDLSAGWSVGVTQHMGPRWRLGLSYRSEVEHELSGTVTASGLTGPLAAANGVRPARAAITLPDSARLGLAFQATDRLQLTAQAEWVGWSDFDALVVRSDTGVTSTRFDYEDRTNYALGADYRLSPAWTVRAGLGWDPTPTTDRERSARVPDSDRTWITAGASRQFGDGAKLDLALGYVAAAEEVVNSERAFYEGSPLQTNALTRGRTENQGVIAAVGYSRRF